MPRTQVPSSAPTPEAKPTPKPAPSSNGPQLTEEELERVAAVMPIADHLRESNMELSAYFEQGVPLIADGKLLRVGLEKGFLFEPQVTTDEARKSIEDAVRAVWGDEATFELVTSSPDATPPRSVSAARGRERKARHEAAIQQVKSHPLVQDAVRIFGAQVRDVRLPESAPS